MTRCLAKNKCNVKKKLLFTFLFSGVISTIIMLALVLSGNDRMTSNWVWLFCTLLLWPVLIWFPGVSDFMNYISIIK